MNISNSTKLGLGDTHMLIGPNWIYTDDDDIVKVSVDLVDISS